MEKLIIVRHGSYNKEDGNLTKDGVQSIQRLAEKIILLTKNNRATIISSTAKRAQQSAQIISETLGVNFETNIDLLSDGDEHPACPPAALNLVSSYTDKTDLLMLVTHLEFLQYMTYRLISELRLKCESLMEFPVGSAWVLDYERRNYFMLRS